MPAAIDISHPPRPAPAHNTWKPSRDEQADLNAIDAVIRRMQQITPPDPYTLSIPQDVEPRYHHSYRSQALQWLNQTPFSANEQERLQYQTFFFYEHGKEMYVLHNSREGEHRSTQETQSRAGAQASGNISSAPKKKISLDAYKRKQNGGSVATRESVPDTNQDIPTKQAAVKGPIEQIKAETDEVLAAAAEPVGLDLLLAQEDVKRTPKSDLKRKRVEAPALKEEVERKETDKSHVATADEDASGMPAAKKSRRTSPPRSPLPVTHSFTHPKAAVITPVKSHARQSSKEERGMPPRLSPGMPEKLSPLHRQPSPEVKQQVQPREKPLPPRLSPTIPENILQALDAEVTKPSGSDGLSAAAPSASKADRALAETDTPEAARHKTQPRNGFRAGSRSPSPGLSDKADSKKSAIAAQSKRAPSVALSSEDELAVGNVLQGRDCVKRRGSLIVRLKIKAKAAREKAQQALSVRGIVRKRSSSPQAKSTPRVTAQRDGAVKGVAQKILPVKKERKSQTNESATTNGKRRSSDAGFDEVATKRSRNEYADPTFKEPSTPTKPERESPTLTLSGHKATNLKHLTPASHLSVPMKRETSRDSLAVSTPQAMSSTPKMANGASHPLPPTSAPSTTSKAHPPGADHHLSTKTPAQQAWELENKPLETLGRELKHAATKHLQTATSSSSSASAQSSRSPSFTSLTSLQHTQLGAIKAVESLLCYLLAFVCIDQVHFTSDPRTPPTLRTWRSLVGFFTFVRRSTAAIPTLHGLTSALGVVYNSHILEIITTNSKLYESQLPEVVLESQPHMLRNALDAEEWSDPSSLQANFPRTWAARTTPLTNKALYPGSGSSSSASKDKDSHVLPTDRGRPPLVPGKFAGPYKLPIGLATHPVEAVRAGIALLREWIQRNDVPYELSLKLT